MRHFHATQGSFCEKYHGIRPFYCPFSCSRQWAKNVHCHKKLPVAPECQGFALLQYIARPRFACASPISSPCQLWYMARLLRVASCTCNRSLLPVTWSIHQPLHGVTAEYRMCMSHRHRMYRLMFRMDWLLCEPQHAAFKNTVISLLRAPPGYSE